MGTLDDVNLTLVESTAEAYDFLRWLGERRPMLGADIETTGLNLAKDHIRLVQFGDAMRGWAFPYPDWRGLIREVLATYDRPMVWHHAKFDAGMLMMDGLSFPWQHTHDTLPMCFLYDSLGPKQLKRAAALHVDPAAARGEMVLKTLMARNQWTWATVPTDFPPYWVYAALDPVLTARLAEKLWPLVQPYREAYDLEMAVGRILTDMELRGARIDVDYCVRTRLDLLEQHGKLLAELAPLDPHKNRQVIDRFLEDGIQLTKRTDKGQLSVDEAVLRSLVGKHLLAEKVLEARRLWKLISAYFDNFLAEREGDLLHPHINQLQARTGRMSVSEPALQQVPKNSLVRDAFIPRDGHKLVLCDYDNEEVRVMAHYANDPRMIQAFQDGRDLHLETAAACYGPEQAAAKRAYGKRAFFAKAYGAGVAKFAKTTGIEETEARAIFSALSRTWPGLDAGMEKAARVVRERAATEHAETGYVVLRDGRRIRVRQDKAYVGWNALIQGNCAVVLKQALVDLEAVGLGDTLILPVHDEIMFDVAESDLVEAVPLIERTMRREDWRVPLVATARVTDRWGDLYRDVED